MIKDQQGSHCGWSGVGGEDAAGKMNDMNKVTLTTDLPIDERDKGRN